jgi:2-hydroxychromene-2-carboxylate isomerase
MPLTIVAYSDYKSPFAYVATAGVFALERDYDVTLDWKPFTLDLETRFGGSTAQRELMLRRVKYSYMDVRRFANKQGLTILGPQKLFDSSPAQIGMLYAQRAGVFRGYHERTFVLFFRRQLDTGDIAAVAGVLREVGADPAGFAAFVDGDGAAAYARIQQEAIAAGVFGVPTFFVASEMFWGGDRLGLVREKLDGMGLRRR